MAVKSFKHILILVGQSVAYQPSSVIALKGNIGLGLKLMPLLNTLAYFTQSIKDEEKCFTKGDS
jgi:hypothetical protein